MKLPLFSNAYPLLRMGEYIVAIITIPSIYATTQPTTTPTTEWPGRDIWISRGMEWGIQRQLLWLGYSTRVRTHRDGTKTLLPNKVKTELPPDSLMDVVKKARKNVGKGEDEKLRNKRDLTDIGTRMGYPKQISRSIRADTTPSLPDDWVGLNWWNLRLTTTSQNPATPSSRDKANTFNNAEASMLRPAVDLTRSDTTVTPPIISVENETTEMEDSVIQDKHSYNTSTSHTTSVPIPVTSIEEVQVGHWDGEENKTAIFYRWQQKHTSILNETEEQYDSQNNFILDEYSRNDVDDGQWYFTQRGGEHLRR